MSDRIVVLYPGRGGTATGYKNKYEHWAHHSLKLGSIYIPLNNPDSVDFDQVVVPRLEAVLTTVLVNYPNTEITLVGKSAGAGAAIACAYKFPITHLVAIAPSLNAGELLTLSGAQQFTGKSLTIVGSLDTITPPNSVFSIAAKFLNNIFIVISGLDHHTIGPPFPSILDKVVIQFINRHGVCSE